MTRTWITCWQPDDEICAVCAMEWIAELWALPGNKAAAQRAAELHGDGQDGHVSLPVAQPPWLPRPKVARALADGPYVQMGPVDVCWNHIMLAPRGDGRRVLAAGGPLPPGLVRKRGQG